MHQDPFQQDSESAVFQQCPGLPCRIFRETQGLLLWDKPSWIFPGVIDTAAQFLFRSLTSACSNISSSLVTKEEHKGIHAWKILHISFFSTKLCPCHSPLEDSEFATTNQNPLGTTAWINQSTTIKSIRLGKKSISHEQVWFSPRLGNSQKNAAIWLLNYCRVWVAFNITNIKAKVFTKTPQVSWVPCLPFKGQDMTEYHRLGKRLQIADWVFPPCCLSQQWVTQVMSYSHQVQINCSSGTLPHWVPLTKVCDTQKHTKNPCVSTKQATWCMALV